MPLVIAGYNRLSGIADVDDDVIITGGLANCIAIVGIDRAFNSMRIAHYDTQYCLNATSGKMDPQRLANFANWMGNYTTIWRVGLGGLWRVGRDGKRPSLFRSLRRAIEGAFNTIPEAEGPCIRMGLLGRPHLVMEADQSYESGWLPQNWSKQGEKIPYTELM